MAMQIPRDIHPKIPPQKPLRGCEEGVGGSVPSFGWPEELPNIGGAHNAGPCPHAHQHTTEIVGIEYGGIPQGEECDPCRTALHEARSQLRRVQAVGEGLFRGQCWPKYRGDRQVYPRTGGRRPTPGRAELGLGS